MNKKYIVIAIIAGIILFGAGSLVGAQSSNWKDNISVDAANTIEQAAKDKTESLTTNIQANIETSVKAKINPLIDQKKQDIADQLQAYFDSKTNDITNSQEYKDSVADLDRIETNYLTKYKAEIDAAFSGQ